MLNIRINNHNIAQMTTIFDQQYLRPSDQYNSKLILR